MQSEHLPGQTFEKLNLVSQKVLERPSLKRETGLLLGHKLTRVFFHYKDEVEIFQKRPKIDLSVKNRIDWFFEKFNFFVFLKKRKVFWKLKKSKQVSFIAFP